MSRGAALPAGSLLVAGLLGVAAFAPILANDKPVLVRLRDGGIRLPALADYPVPGSWWRRLTAGPGGTDTRLAIRPPIPFSGRETDLGAILRPPGRLHRLGTDSLGRDVAARMVHGAGASMTVGIAAVGIAAGIGILIGALAGLFGGWVDFLLSRVLEVAFCFPTLFLILALVGIPGSRGVLPIVLAIGVTRWTPIARYVRGEILSLRERDFVRSARAAGASDGRILLRHLVPHSLPPVIVTAAFGVAGAILLETALSFLGFGIQPPDPSWGNILAEARDALGRGWWLAVWPTLAIFLTVLGFNSIGEGLRDRIDPRRGEWALDAEAGSRREAVV